MNHELIEIYSDGSCNTNHKIGAWAAILLIANEKILIKGEVQNTSNNRMELLAVIKAIEFADKNCKKASFMIYTDSQYVFRIPERMEKLNNNNFITKNGKLLHNHDLIQTLIHNIETHNIEFVKVKAHQQAKTNNLNTHLNLNSEVDKSARQIVREAVKRIL